MYPRLKRVRRGDQVHEYVQLVEGRREAGKVRQRVVATLGRLDELKASGLLNDDRLGRAVDALAPVVEDVRARTLLATLERFEVEASRLHLDLTAVRFAGAYLDSALVAKGWAADRTVGRQVRALFATTAQGVTLYARPQKGSQAELDGIAAALEALRRLCPPGLVTVIDSAAGNLKTLAAIDRQKLRFVVPLRADNGWAARFDVDLPGG